MSLYFKQYPVKNVNIKHLFFLFSGLSDQVATTSEQTRDSESDSTHCKDEF